MPTVFFSEATIEATIVGCFVITFILTLTRTSRAILVHSTDALRHARAAEQSANFDSVTLLPNRRNFMLQLNDALIANPAEAYSVMMLDLDQFKRVNDTRGHAVGDELLIKAAERIVSHVRHYDPGAVIARFGGDEFVVLTREPFDIKMADGVIAALRQPFDINADRISIGASAGICRRDGSHSALDLLKFGDIALYEAKESGRNRYCLFNAALGAKAAARARTEERFQLAMAAERLTLAYQPIVDIDTGAIVSAEALARWTDDELGAVPPVVFIRIAEQTGLISRLFELLLQKACMEAAAWPRQIPIAFNVSAQQLQNGPALITQVQRALTLSALPACRLELEITESTLVRNFDEIAPTIQALRDIGVRIALDDFGAGFCSLSYLNKFAFDKIKIDQELAALASRSPTQATIIRMIATIGSDLGADVVAEGVEEEACAIHLRHLGVRLAQGFFFGRPQPLSAIVAALAKRPDDLRRAGA